jgi:hypothetical protein
MLHHYIMIAIVAIALIAILIFVIKPIGQRGKLSLLAALAFSFIVAGFFFENRWFGYSFMGVGIILAVADIIKKTRKNKLS